MKEKFQNMYKTWGGMTKAVRATVVKMDKSSIINIGHFGKIYVLVKQSEKEEDKK